MCVCICTYLNIHIYILYLHIDYGAAPQPDAFNWWRPPWEDPEWTWNAGRSSPPAHVEGLLAGERLTKKRLAGFSVWINQLRRSGHQSKIAQVCWNDAIVGFKTPSMVEFHQRFVTYIGSFPPSALAARDLWDEGGFLMAQVITSKDQITQLLYFGSIFWTNLDHGSNTSLFVIVHHYYCYTHIIVVQYFGHVGSNTSLVGGDWNINCIFPYIGNNHPNWGYVAMSLAPPIKLMVGLYQP